MKYTIEQITSVLNLPLPDKQATRIITQLLTDSRQLFHPETTLFVALSSERQDGHRYISELYRKGVRAFLVLAHFDTTPYPEACFIKVSDPLTALQKLAAAWRRKFSIPVIGITGSNGKTVIKEWLFQLLKPDYHIVRSPKSYNSQTGVPLSVVEMNPTHQLAIFEAGISQPKEMEKLQKIILPDLGIFTNIGEAHAEGFANVREKIREKLRLFSTTQLLIFSEDDAVVNKEIHAFQNEQEEKPFALFSWSRKSSGSARLIITGIQKRKTGEALFSTIKARYDEQEVAIEIPFTDEGSIENAIHCWCLMLYLKINQEAISRRMTQLQPVAMRLEMKNGIQNCTLINDSYNTDFTSIKVALDFLYHQRQHEKHTLILSDIVQSGEEERILYEQIAALLSKKRIQRFIGIGKALQRQKESFNHLSCTSFYPTTESFIEALHRETASGRNLPFHDETILLKGARSFGFERISKLLEQKKHQTELIVNLNALIHNLKAYQSLLRTGVRTMVMVKAFSYGSGSAEIANLLQFYRVDYLAVANIDEGIDLRKNGITLPIVVLNPDPFYFDELARWQLEPELYSLSTLKGFQEVIARLGIAGYPVHLKLDTGMHRLGFSPEQIPALTALLREQKTLQVASVFSHLVASEDPRMDEFTQKQAQRFEEMSGAIAAALPYPVLRHLANTAGISRHPDLQYDMVRLGIGVYGIDPAMHSKLQVVHTLKTTISQIKEVTAGETIGYGRAGIADTDKRIAVVALGYADGYLRSLGKGKARMSLHGKWAPTIGQICMDMLMLDITHIPEAEEGDRVDVFGQKPRIEELAAWGDTIPYEILTGLSQRIVRIYIQE